MILVQPFGAFTQAKNAISFNKLGKIATDVFSQTTNHKLINHAGNSTTVHVWEFKNNHNNRWYQCRDQAIRWTDGRLVRIEIATDITDRK